MNEIVEIMPNMFLGTANATNSHVLARFGIQCVLNVATKRDFLNDGNYVLDDYLPLEIEDSWDASKKMSQNIIPTGLAFIDKHYPMKRVLVHCSAGRSRSATIVAAWLMRRYGFTLDESLKHLRIFKPDVNPNHGFIMALQSWNKNLKS